MDTVSQTQPVPSHTTTEPRATITIEPVTDEIREQCAPGARVAIVLRTPGEGPHVPVSDHWLRDDPAHTALARLLSEIDLWRGSADVILPGLDVLVALGADSTAAARQHLTARWTSPVTVAAEYVQPGWRASLASNDGPWFDVVDVAPCAEADCPNLGRTDTEDCTRLVLDTGGEANVLHKRFGDDELLVRIPAEVTA